MRIHIFVDVENISPILFEKSFAYLKHRYEIVKVDIIGKEAVLPTTYTKYRDNPRFRFTNCFYGKNSADTFLTAYIVRALFEESLTDGFVVISQDRDLAIAVKFITDYHKQAILVSEENKEFQHLKDIGADMNLVCKLGFEVKKPKKHTIPYFGIPEVQKKNFTYTPTTIFIKTGENKLIRVHFYNGIKYNLFLNIIPVKKIRQGYSTSRKFKDILKESYLCVIKDKVYVDIDLILQEENL